MVAVDSTAVADFLTAAAAGPSALIVEGEAGIGKTTLWLAAVAAARERGFRVLSAQPAAAESVLAYASLADLLSEVDTARLGGSTRAAAARAGSGSATHRVTQPGNRSSAPSRRRSCRSSAAARRTRRYCWR